MSPFWRRHNWIAVTGSYRGKISIRSRSCFYYSTCYNVSDSYLSHQWTIACILYKSFILRSSWTSQGWLTSPPMLAATAEWQENWSLRLWGTCPWRGPLNSFFELNCTNAHFSFFATFIPSLEAVLFLDPEIHL